MQDCAKCSITCSEKGVREYTVTNTCLTGRPGTMVLITVGVPKMHLSLGSAEGVKDTVERWSPYSMNLRMAGCSSSQAGRWGSQPQAKDKFVMRKGQPRRCRTKVSPPRSSSRVTRCGIWCNARRKSSPNALVRHGYPDSRHMDNTRACFASSLCLLMVLRHLTTTEGLVRRTSAYKYMTAIFPMTLLTRHICVSVFGSAWAATTCKGSRGSKGNMPVQRLINPC